MLCFKLIGKDIEPLAPGTAEPNGVDILDVAQAAERTGKTKKQVRDSWVAKWGDIAPPTDIDGKPLADPLARPADVKVASLKLSDEQREEMVRQMLYPQLSPEFFKMFKLVCAQRGFSIYWRQLHPEQRFDEAAGAMRLVVITTIDGLGTIAMRTGDYDGPVTPEYAGEDGVFTTTWDDRKGPPVWARAGARRKSFSQPVVSVVQWHTYAPYTPGPRGPILDPWWEMLGSQQLGKCGLALSLRTTFPDALSGIYMREEMQQANSFQPTRQQQPQGRPTSASVDSDTDSQVTEDEVSEEEFTDLMNRAAPASQHDLLMRTYKLRYAKLWKLDQLRFYRVVARDLQQLIREQGA